MTSDLRPYPEYKDSGVRWLGRVPAHWDIRASKRTFAESGERAWPDDEQLSATQSHGVILQTEYERIVGRKVVCILQHLDKRKHVEKDDFVISMRSFQGGLERAWARGAIRSSYVVLKPGRGTHVPYFAHLFKSHPYIQALRTTSEFIRDGQDLTFSNFCLVPLPVVPMEEQKAIADFLDANAVKVRRFIRNRRRLIKVLNEQKQAIINRAVTRGLDPNVRLKPSGIEWLGDIPQHWRVVKLKRVGRIRYGLGQPPKESRNGLPLIRATNVKSGRIVTKNLVYVDPADVPTGRDAILRCGEIIVVRSGALTADSAIIPNEYGGAVAGYDMVVTVTEAMPPFVAAALLSRYMLSDQLFLLKSRAAQPHLNAEELGNAVVVLPPEDEQKTIVQHVDEQTVFLGALIDRAEREILLIREYRIRLIADVVTGKLDVRHLAPAERSPADEINDEDNLATAEKEMVQEEEAELVEDVREE